MTNLSELTAAERLFIWRHRQRSTNGRLMGRNGQAMSQREAAEALGVGYSVYTHLENGGRARLSADEVEQLLGTLGPLRPSLGELCYVARRRSGRYLHDLEQEVGVSRPTYHALERNGDTRIVKFWEAKGYVFPDKATI